MVRNDHNRRESKNRKKHFKKANKTRSLKQYIMGTYFSHTPPFWMVLSAHRVFYSALYVSRYRYSELERSNVVQLDLSTRIIFRFLYEDDEPGKKNTQLFRVITPKNRCNHLSHVHAYISDCHIMARPLCYRQTVHDTSYLYDSRRYNSGDYDPSTNLVLYLSYRNNIKLDGKEQTTTLMQKRSLHKLQTMCQTVPHESCSS